MIIFSESEITSSLSKNGVWTIDELANVVPNKLLKNYLPIIKRDSWKGESGENLSQSVIFDRGLPIEGFSNEAYLNRISGFNHPSHCSIGNVTFGPGSHNNWHRHFGYQVLMVTGGKGLYQEKGKPVRHLSKGDVAIVEPGVTHWHGATSKDWFVHIAMILNEEKSTEDMGILSEEEDLILNNEA